MSIRARLSVWYGLAFVAIVAGAGALVWIQVGRDLRASLDDALRVHAIDVRGALDADDAATIEIRDPGRPGVFTVVLGADGSLVRATANAPVLASAPPLGSSELRSLDDTFALHAIATRDDGLVVTGSTLAEVERARESLTAGLLLVGCLAGIVAVGGGWWLAGRALAPVASLVHELETIDVDDLGRRVGPSPRMDELGRLRRAIDRMLGRIDDGVQRQQAFVAAASHDLRTPIAALRTELELAERGPADPDILLAAIRAARGDAVRLGHLANDVLALAEAEPGGRPLSRQPVSVLELVSHAAHSLETAARQRSVTVELEARDDAVANVDRSRIEQATRNLLANAVRLAPSGTGVTVSARVETPATRGEASRRWLEVSVADHGPGVPRDVRPMLFLPFGVGSTGNGSGGLGLATAAASVRAHGGEIGYHDREGGGAVFWFRVPA